MEKRVLIVIAVLLVVAMASSVELYAISRGIDGKCLQAFIGIAGTGLGVLGGVLISRAKRKEPRRGKEEE